MIAIGNRQKYRDFCDQNPEQRLFSSAWWLDAVCGECWDAALVEKDSIIAALPYTWQKVGGLSMIKMPQLTPWLDIFIRHPEGQKYASRLAFEKDVLTQLIEQLPSVARFRQRYGYSFTNWLPFYWHGFQQTTRYSYVIPDLSDLDALFAGFRENVRREIRKAQKRLTVVTKDDLDLFYQIVQKTFQRQKLRPTFSRQILGNIDRACQEHKRRQIYFAIEGERIHASLYVVWDAQSAYYLLGGADPALRNSGATSLLMWHAIQEASRLTRQFDFEGSMIEPIERYFRSFGARQTPYFSISRNRGLFKLAEPFIG